MTDRDPRAMMEEAKRPVSAVAGPYGHPFHPILVTVPIGAWVTSLVLDIGSMLADLGAGLARASAWAITVGLIGAAAAAVFGVMDFLVIPRGTQAARVALTHLGLNTAVILAFGISLGLRMGRGTDQPVDATLLVLSVAALLVLGMSGWLGGKLTYRYGVRVVNEDIQREGFAG
jgi:uncharacterized membrane protein